MIDSEKRNQNGDSGLLLSLPPTQEECQGEWVMTPVSSYLDWIVCMPLAKEGYLKIEYWGAHSISTSSTSKNVAWFL